MGELIIKKFVKDYENVTDGKVRERYGMVSSIVGVCCNVILFIIKFVLGTLSNSISIISDAFNNLSDCASCVVTMFGYKMANKPADRDHPFGHGRMEYLTSLVIAMVIIVVGFELLKNSVAKIIHPEELDFSYIALIGILFSILIKLWMFMFNRKYGKRINSSVMLATSKDSISDVMATSATLIALVASVWTAAPIDGVMGTIVSVLIIFAGIGIVRETVDELLGQPASAELMESLAEIVNECDSSLGMHDVIIHSYGPGNLIGSLHIEVDCRNDIMLIHDDIDNLERDIYEKLGVRMTIHMDPVETDNQTLNDTKKMVQSILEDIYEENRKELGAPLSMHDFRMVSGKTHTNLIFDIVLPHESSVEKGYIEKIINRKLDKQPIQYHAHITFDTEYVNYN